MADAPTVCLLIFGGEACPDWLVAQWALRGAVVPAKAGIQTVHSAFPKACEVDSRLRGNERRFEREPMPNDTSPAGGFLLDKRGSRAQFRSFSARACIRVSDNWGETVRRRSCEFAFAFTTSVSTGLAQPPFSPVSTRLR